MKIYWNRIVAFVFALTGLVLLIRYRHPILAFLSNLERIGPGYSPEDQTLGLIALGLIGVIIVAIVKILTHQQK